jgi:ketosteroid isomerase-like protein
MRTALIGLLMLLVPALAAAGGDAEADILAVMRAAEDGWNAGDLEAYMVGYWRSEDLRFASGGDVARGWETTLARYTRGYPDRDAMGKLTFSDMDVTLLADDAAYVFGRWRLDRAEDAPEGLFTLIFRKTDAGWRIVHDHTSAAD